MDPAEENGDLQGVSDKYIRSVRSSRIWSDKCQSPENHCTTPDSLCVQYFPYVSAGDRLVWQTDADLFCTRLRHMPRPHMARRSVIRITHGKKSDINRITVKHTIVRCIQYRCCTLARRTILGKICAAKNDSRNHRSAIFALAFPREFPREMEFIR